MSIPSASVNTWFAAHARPLPWREPDCSPWGILLSEVMSQQTPVARVEPRWHEWMQRWPSPADVAAASRADILRAWDRLGYPRRALRLHECAVTITRDHKGQVPEHVDQLLALPGIGDYTARAVACFAFGHAVPVVDTNVRRVLARAIDGQFLPGPARRADLQQMAAAMPAVSSYDENGYHPAKNAAEVTAIAAGAQFCAAVMELGAMVCTARRAHCDLCPIRDSCAWIAAGQPEPSRDEVEAARGRVQKFAGTDRQVRGRIMAIARQAHAPLPRSDFSTTAADQVQFERAMDSLLADGLLVADAGHIALAT